MDSHLVVGRTYSPFVVKGYQYPTEPAKVVWLETVFREGDENSKTISLVKSEDALLRKLPIVLDSASANSPFHLYRYKSNGTMSAINEAYIFLNPTDYIGGNDQNVALYGDNMFRAVGIYYDAFVSPS